MCDRAWEEVAEENLFWFVKSLCRQLIEPTCISEPTPAEETFTFGINDGESPNGIAELDELVTSVDAFSFFRVTLNPTSTNEIGATMTVLGSLTSSGLNIRLKELTEIWTHLVLFATLADWGMGSLGTVESTSYLKFYRPSGPRHNQIFVATSAASICRNTRCEFEMTA